MTSIVVGKYEEWLPELEPRVWTDRRITGYPNPYRNTASLVMLSVLSIKRKSTLVFNETKKL